MRKPAVDKMSPRRVGTGAAIWSRDFKTTEVVRGVSVVIHLANGHDEVYQDSDAVEVLRTQPEPVTDDEVEVGS